MSTWNNTQTVWHETPCAPYAASPEIMNIHEDTILTTGNAGNGELYTGATGISAAELERMKKIHQELQDRLQLALRSGNIGLWDWNLKTNKVQYSKEWKSQIGYAEDEIGDDYREWESRVHPDDLGPALAKIQLCLKDPNAEYVVEFRFRHKGGGWRWILARGDIQYDEQGKPESMLGSHTDITQLKHGEEIIREKEMLLAESQRIAQVGSWRHDLSSDRITLSDELYNIYGVRRDAFEPDFKSVLQLIHPEDLPAFLAWIDASLAGKRPGALECRIVRPDGAIRHLRGTGELQYGPDNYPLYVTGAVHDITALRETQIAETESRLRMEHLLTANPAVLYSLRVVGVEFFPIFISDSITRILGYEAEEAMRRDWWPTHIHPEDRDSVRSAIAGVLKKDRLTLTYRLIHKRGHAIYIRDEIRIIHDQQGQATEVVGAWTDITSQYQEQERIRIYASAFAHTTEGMLITDLVGNILSVNRALLEITGYPEQELLGRNPRILKSGRHDRPFYQIMWNQLLNHGQWRGELWNRRKNGEVYPTLLNISRVLDNSGAPSHYVANCTDIAPMKKTQFELERLAHYDPLTELPNRLLLQSRLEHAIEQAKRNNRLLGLLFIDLDDFKKINDSLGHRYGDELLVAVARRWRKRLRAEDTLGRLGGDEFVLLLENIQDSDEIGTVARDMVGALAAPFKLIDDTEVFLETSVGISIFPADGDSAEILLRNADTAMYRAKEQGRNQFRFYTGDMGASAVERLELETALRLGIERKELVLYFQPKVDLRSGKISGAEALIRWNRGGSGLVPPPKFIPLAEKTGLINPIGEWVIHEACRQLRHWLDQGLNPPDVAVNVSAHQIQKQDLRAVVWRALQEHNIKPELLGLEITESALMGRPEQIIEILQSLKHMGITISLDDFGTGYSNLSYLTRYPIDVLKIDASFIRGIGRDPNAMKVINSVIDLTHNIDLRTVAEGVETPEQLNYLAQNGCDYIQGYYFSKPLPAGEFETLLREGRSIDTAGFPI